MKPIRTTRPPHLCVREAHAGDEASLAELVTELGYPASTDAIARRFDRLHRDPATWLYVAVAQGRVVGLAALHVMSRLEHDEPLGRITALVVAEDARGTGAGRALLERVEDAARRQGCAQLELTSGDHRRDAHVFYERLGFSGVSRRFVKDVPA
jgi:GNAT superfamily N-acetyltransferase